MQPLGWGATEDAEHRLREALDAYQAEMRLAQGNRNYAHQAARLASTAGALLAELDADRKMRVQ